MKNGLPYKNTRELGFDGTRVSVCILRGTTARAMMSQGTVYPGYAFRHDWKTLFPGDCDFHEECSKGLPPGRKSRVWKVTFSFRRNQENTKLGNVFFMSPLVK